MRSRRRRAQDALEQTQDGANAADLVERGNEWLLARAGVFEADVDAGLRGGSEEALGSVHGRETLAEPLLHSSSVALRNRFALAVGAVLLTLATPVCAPIPDDDVLVVGALPFVSSAPLFLAQEAGFYEREGLSVELRFFRAAQPVALATMTGDIDFGVTGLTAGFYNLAGEGRLKVVAGQSSVVPGYHFIAYCVSAEAWDLGLRSLDDLAGHRVGITQQGSTFHYMVGRLAEERGFALEDVDLVSLESVSNMVAALRGGSVEMILLPAHLAEPLVVEGVAQILGWAGDETPWQLGALFTSSENLENRPQVVERFVRAYRSAAQLYAGAFLQRDANGERQFGEEALRLAGLLQEYIPSTVPEILAGAPFIERDVGISATAIAPQILWFQRRDLVDPRVEASLIVDDRFVVSGSVDP